MTPTPERAAELESFAAHWDGLALECRRDGRKLTAECCARTAETLRVLARTGVVVCLCCFKPYGEGH